LLLNAGELVFSKPAWRLAPVREKSGEQHPSGARVGRSSTQPGAGSASGCPSEGGGGREQLCRDVGDGSRRSSTPEGL